MLSYFIRLRNAGGLPLSLLRLAPPVVRSALNDISLLTRFNIRHAVISCACFSTLFRTWWRSLAHFHGFLFYIAVLISRLPCGRIHRLLPLNALTCANILSPPFLRRWWRWWNDVVHGQIVRGDAFRGIQAAHDETASRI
jgi:hypothetical protein